MPAGNPASATGVDAFGDERLLVGLCAPGVPCGTAARTVLVNAGVTPLPDTNEPNVRSLVTKLEVGEIDAFVDALAGGHLRVFTAMTVAVRGSGFTATGINDVVIEKVVSERIIEIGVSINGHKFADYRIF